MGKRDYRHREAKKSPKKGAKKVELSELLPLPPPVEVTKKGKKTEEEE